MKKITKRLIAFMLSLTLVLSEGLVALAAELQSAAEQSNLVTETNENLNEDGTLKDGTYSLTVSMMNASNHESASMAASCIAEPATLQVKDGKSTVTLNVTCVSVMSITGWASNWKIYQENSCGSSASTVEATEMKDEEDHVTQVVFDLPNAAYTWGGVYANFYVEVMSMTPDAWLAMDFANAEKLDTDKTFAFGSSGTELRVGEYDLPVALKNASNITADSAAASCINGDAKLVVQSDGSAKITLYLQAVTMMGISDWAQDWKIYPDYTDKSTTEDADYTTNTDGKVDSITYTIPDITADGTYINMYVDAMARNVDAYVAYDYASLLAETETYNGTFHIAQFGEYDINTAVSVKGNKITGVEITGDNFGGTYAETNKSMLQKAINGLKDAFTGKKADDAESVYGVDAVSGATYSSHGIRDSVMNALSLEHQEEIIDLPTEKLQEGEYDVDISFYTDAVTHYVTGEEKTKAKIVVDADGAMILVTDIKNGTAKEPLYITEFKGYYTDNDTTKALATEKLDVTKGEIDYTDTYFPKDTKVVTRVSFPLVGDFAGTYNTKIHLYVPAMNNLNGNVGGVDFENGWFDVDCFAKIYWNSIQKVENKEQTPIFGTAGISLEAGQYILPVSMKNATNIEKDSMAASCLNGATLVVNEDGSATVILDLQPVSVMGQSGWASKWKIYQSDTSSDTAEAAVTKTDADDHVTQIAFTLPDNRADGVYVNMFVDAMNGTVDAYLAFNYAKAEKSKSLEDGIYAVTGQMLKVDLSTASMADSAINKTMMLEVKDGKVTLTMDFHGMKISGTQGYLGALKYYETGYTKDSNGNPIGTLKDATVKSVQKYSDGTAISDDYGKDYPDVVSFELIPEALEDGIVPLQVFVPIMESIASGTGNQNVYLKLDLDNLRKTTAEDEVFKETEEAPANPAAPSDTPSPTPDAGIPTPPASSGTPIPGNEVGANTPTPNPTTNVGTPTPPVSSGTPTPTKQPDTSAKTLKVGQTVKIKGSTYKVTAEGKVAFVKCKKNAKTIKIPATVKVSGVTCKVTSVAKNAFKNNKKLTKVTFGKYITKVGKNAFKGCKKLKQIKLPKGISKKKKVSLKKQIKKAGVSSKVKIK